MLAIRSGTPGKLPRRMFLSVSSRKNRSTRFSQLDEVGVKCRWNRLCLLSHCTVSGRLWVWYRPADLIHPRGGRKRPGECGDLPPCSGISTPNGSDVAQLTCDG